MLAKTEPLHPSARPGPLAPQPAPIRRAPVANPERPDRGRSSNRDIVLEQKKRQFKTGLLARAQKGEAWARSLRQPNARIKFDEHGNRWLESCLPPHEALPCSKPFVEGGFCKVSLLRRGELVLALRTSSFWPPRGYVHDTTQPLSLHGFERELAAMQIAESPLQPLQFWGTGNYSLSMEVRAFAASADNLIEEALQPLQPLDRSALIFAAAKNMFGRLCLLHAAEWVHVDVKPSNLLVDADGFELGDFGLARPAETNGTWDKHSDGTQEYQAPEALVRDATGRHYGYTAAADMFACGLTLLEMALGNDFRSPSNMSEEEIADSLRVGLATWHQLASPSDPPQAPLPNGLAGSLSALSLTWGAYFYRAHRQTSRQVVELVSPLLQLEPSGRPSAKVAYDQADAILRLTQASAPGKTLQDRVKPALAEALSLLARSSASDKRREAEQAVARVV